MGSKIAEYYRNHISTGKKAAFLGAFFCGLLAYGYAFANTLINRDTPYAFYTEQNLISLGRWAIQYACGITGYYLQPWQIGLFILLYLGGTALLVAALFRVQNPVAGFLLGGLLVANPAVSNMMEYLYGMDGFALAFLLAALGVWFLRMEAPLWQNGLGIVAIGLSCGIYQALVSFAMVLALCYFIWRMVALQDSLKQVLIWVGKQLIAYPSAMVVYYLGWRLCQKITNNYTVSGYQGISGVALNRQTIKDAFIKVWQELQFFFFQVRDGVEHRDLYTVLNKAFLVLLAALVVTAVVKAKLWKRPVHFLLAVAAGAVVPIAAFIWFFSSPELYYSIRMMVGMIPVYLLAVVLAEQIVAHWAAADVAGLLLAVILLNNTVMCGQVIFYLERTTLKSYGDAYAMIQRIHQLDPRGELEISIVGGLNMTPDWYNEEVRNSIYMQETLRSSAVREYLTASVMRYAFAENYRCAAGELRESIINSEEFAQMGIWPAEDSVRVIDNVVVIKCYT